MGKEPENLVLTILREIRSKQDERTARFANIEARLRHIEKQFDSLSTRVTYSLGQ